MHTFKRVFAIVLSCLLLVSVTAVGTAHAVTTGQGYVIIDNESTDGTGSAYTGSFNINNQNYTMNKQLKPSSYKMDYVKPFNIAKNNTSKVRRNTMYASFAIGDSKSFWVSNI